jgi:hypothetical protein
MSTEIRLLDLNDLDTVLTLQNTIRTYAGVPSEVKKTYTNYSYINYFLNPDEKKYFMFGFFLEGQLLSTIGSIDNQEMPAWTLSKYHAIPNKHNAAAKLQTYLIDFQEKKKLYQYFTCHAQNKFAAHDRHWTRLVPLRNRYTAYLEHIVAPNEFTGYENIDHDVLAYTKWPETLVIHLRVLKDEYRTY